MKRTPGGRVKNAAVKYQKDEDLDLALKRTTWGAHAEHPAWICVLMLTGAISKEQIKLVRLHLRKTKSRYPSLMLKPEKALKSFLAWVIKNKKWDEWDKVSKMFKVGLAFPKSDWFKDIDPLRNVLIKANFTLYAMNFLSKKNVTTKGPLLKLLRGLFPEETLNKDDADLFKVMRELGLPRSPDQTTKYFKAYVEICRPSYLRAQAQLDKKKTNIQ